MEVCVLLHVPVAMTSRKEPLVLDKYEAGWVADPARTVWRGGKSLTLP